MKKNLNNNGFMLAETLIVTTFVAGVLIFIYIQFSNLSRSYNASYSYNKVQDLYVLSDIRDAIEGETHLIMNLEGVGISNYLDVTNCMVFDDKEYFLKLFNLANVEKILITNNDITETNFDDLADPEFLDFINSIKSGGNQKYRIIAKFKTDTYATIRFGE